MTAAPAPFPHRHTEDAAMEDHKGTKVAAGHQQIVESVRGAMQARGLTQGEVARQAGMSAAVLSSVLSGSYKGNSDEAARKIERWRADMEVADRLNAGLGRFDDFVETPTAVKIEHVCTFTRARRIIGLIAGASGVGKSKALRQIPGHHSRAWYCQFKREDGRTVPATLAAIGRAIGLYSTSTRGSTLSGMIVDQVSRTNGLLILDEAQHLRCNSLETVRSIFDASEDEKGRSVGLVLAGHLDLVDKVAALPQLDGRVGRRLVLPTATEADVDALCEHWELACPQARNLLRSRARDRTGLRRIAKVFELAVSIAAREGTSPTYEHVRSAWRAFDGSAAN